MGYAFQLCHDLVLGSKSGVVYMGIVLQAEYARSRPISWVSLDSLQTLCGDVCTAQCELCLSVEMIGQQSGGNTAKQPQGYKFDVS